MNFKHSRLRMLAVWVTAFFAFSYNANSQCDCPTNLLTNSGFENGTTGYSATTSLYTGTGFEQCGTNNNGFLQATSQAGWVWQTVPARLINYA